MERLPSVHLDVSVPRPVSHFPVAHQVRYSRAVLLSLIAAASDNGVIGKKNWLPWDLPDELQYFRATTTGKPVIMGRKTYDSIGRPMPNRHNIVVSRTPDLSIEGCDVTASVEEAVALARKDGVEEGFIIGGAQIYQEALPLADRFYLTRVHTHIDDGDTFLPTIDWSQWKKVSSKEHPADERHAHAFTMEVWEKAA